MINLILNFSTLLICTLSSVFLIGQAGSDTEKSYYVQRGQRNLDTILVSEDQSGIVISKLFVVNYNGHKIDFENVLFEKINDYEYKGAVIKFEYIYDKTLICFPKLRKISKLLYEIDLSNKDYKDKLIFIKVSPEFTNSNEISLRFQKTNENRPISKNNTTMFLDSMVICGNKFTYSGLKNQINSSDTSNYVGCYHDKDYYGNYNYKDKGTEFTYKITNNSQSYRKIQFLISGAQYYKYQKYSDEADYAYALMDKEFKNIRYQDFLKYDCNSFSYYYFILLKPQESFLGIISSKNDANVSVAITNSDIIEKGIYDEVKMLKREKLPLNKIKHIIDNGLSNILYKYSKMFLNNAKKNNTTDKINEFVNVNFITLSKDYDPDFENTLKIEVTNKSKFTVNCKFEIDSGTFKSDQKNIGPNDKYIFEIPKVTKIQYSDLKFKTIVYTELENWTIESLFSR